MKDGTTSRQRRRPNIM